MPRGIKLTEPYRTLERHATSKEWHGIQQYAGRLSALGIKPKDITNSILTGQLSEIVSGGASSALRLYRTNQFINAVNSLRARKPWLGLPRLARIPTRGDKREALQNKLLDSYRVEFGEILKEMPPGSRETFANCFLNIGLALQAAGYSQFTVADLLKSECIRIALRSFGPTRKASASRSVALTLLRHLANYYADDDALERLKYFRTRITLRAHGIPNHILLRLTPYYDRAEIAAIARKARLAVDRLEKVQNLTKPVLYAAQAGIILVISIFCLYPYALLKDLRLVQKRGLVRLVDKSGREVDSNWPKPVRAIIRRYHNAIADHLDTRSTGLFVTLKGRARNWKSATRPHTRYVMRKWGITLPPRYIRLIGVIQLLFANTPHDEICARGKWKSVEAFNFHYRQLIRDIKVLRDAENSDDDEDV
ncbi:MAG: hypothetical protein WDN02_06715 [Methylovirgula sp.]|uniref:hypothetical protein n=1 Tax=Methylovirgula sp. TaxID=1978224 RepID=UPI0030766889